MMGTRREQYPVTKVCHLPYRRVSRVQRAVTRPATEPRYGIWSTAHHQAPFSLEPDSAPERVHVVTQLSRPQLCAIQINYCRAAFVNKSSNFAQEDSKR